MAPLDRVPLGRVPCPKAPNSAQIGERLRISRRGSTVRPHWGLGRRSGVAAGLLIGLGAVYQPAYSQGRLFPDVPGFHLPFASPRVAGLAGRYINALKGDSRFGSEQEGEVVVGEDFPLLALRRGPQPITMGFGVEVYSRFSLSDSKTAMISHDWLLGFSFHADLNPWEMSLQLQHESSHLGDEYAERFNVSRVDWSRGVVTVGLGYRTGPFRLSGSAGKVVTDELDRWPWRGSVSLDFRGGGFTIAGQPVHPMAGLFTEGASDAGWRLSSRAKVGLALPGASFGNELRFSIFAHDGLSSQLQFYGKRNRFIGWEIGIQL